jgi:hypothetical protein
MHLAANKSKPGTQFEQESLDMLRQRPLEVPLAGIIGQSEKVEDVRVLQCLLCQVRLRRRQGVPAICEGLPLAGVEAALDLVHEDGP